MIPRQRNPSKFREGPLPDSSIRPNGPWRRPLTRTTLRTVGNEAKVLGRLLVEANAIREPQLQEALAEQRDSRVRLGQILLKRGALDGETLARMLARQLSLPYAEPPPEADEGSARRLPSSVAREREILPLASGARTLSMAMVDPLDLATVEEVEFRSGKRVEVSVGSRRAVGEGIRRAYGVELLDLASAVPSRSRSGRNEARVPEGALPGGVGAAGEGRTSAPAARLVDRLLRDGVEDGASDIHLEREGGRLLVRERIDGVLQSVRTLPAEAHDAVLSRLKVLAGMDIAVKRRPQDGGFPLPVDRRTLSLRVSTLPVEGGEKAVVRILDPHDVPDGLETLGLSPEALSSLRSLIRAGRGVVLTAGPTGSGKSSTLFGALGELDREALNVVTLEDPVEYRVEGVSQVQVRPQAGLTFPKALRAVLRQDPDVVMVGEIRDRETAEIAMAAAVTGHLVLSTIHTTHAPGAITRLLNMGVPRHLVAGGLAGVVAQRLVRRLCSGCGGRPAGRAGEEGLAPCSHCAEGYRGRIGVFQLLRVTDAIREEVMRGASTPVLYRLGKRAGMGELREDGRRKVAEGVTDPHEISRVLPPDPGAGFACRVCESAIPTEGRGCPSCGRPRARFCRCERELQPGWRFCPYCLRKAGSR